MGNLPRIGKRVDPEIQVGDNSSQGTPRSALQAEVRSNNTPVHEVSDAPTVRSSGLGSKSCTAKSSWVRNRRLGSLRTSSWTQWPTKARVLIEPPIPLHFYPYQWICAIRVCISSSSSEVQCKQRNNAIQTTNNHVEVSLSTP